MLLLLISGKGQKFGVEQISNERVLESGRNQDKVSGIFFFGGIELVGGYLGVG